MDSRRLTLAIVALVWCFSGTRLAAEVPVRTSEYLAVDGAELFLLTRGADRNAPLVLWLHGAGGTEGPLFRYFNAGLEDHFVVAYWDQRGAGRSFDPDADPHALTIARHLADLDAVVDHLRQSFGQEKVTLIGHSWGGALGLLYARAHPGKVATFIGVAPMISTRAAQRAEYEFISSEASRRKDGQTEARLQELGAPPYDSTAKAYAVARLTARYGGLFHQQPNRYWATLRAILTGVVAPWEIPPLTRGNVSSVDAMREELLELDLSKSVPSVDVPVVFALGRYDHRADAKLAAAYLERLHAPAKRLIWFEGSAHNVPFEEPELFNRVVRDELQGMGMHADRR
jgi:pimeloyl-ACP methyl ester carboxylesterase